MIVKYNDVESLVVSEIEKQILAHTIPTAEVEATIIKDIKWIINEKLTNCSKRLRDQWEPKLIAEGAQSIPLRNDAFAELIFARADYKDRKTLDSEATQPGQ